MSKNKKPFFEAPAHSESEIQLSNPFAASFEQFIVYNAMVWISRAIAEIQPDTDPRDLAVIEAGLVRMGQVKLSGDWMTWVATFDFIRRRLGDFANRYVVQAGSAKGQHLILCGAGPSLADHADEWCKQGDQVWGCNSAVTWLSKNGYNPTHAFTVDQTPHMYLEWREAPDDIEYLVASSIHPHLADMLIDRGCRFRYFNNFVGIRKPPVGWPDANGKEQVMSYEEWIYALLFPGTIQAGAGLNTVTRALDVAAYMDFDRVTVLGADCSIRAKRKPPKGLRLNSPEHKRWLRKNTVMHADGGHALASEATSAVLQATIDDRFWMTKPDMVISAQWLVRMAKASRGKIKLVGDTLPNALYDKEAKFWDRMPALADSDGNRIAIPY